MKQDGNLLAYSIVPMTRSNFGGSCTTEFEFEFLIWVLPKVISGHLAGGSWPWISFLFTYVHFLRECRLLPTRWLEVAYMQITSNCLVGGGLKIKLGWATQSLTWLTKKHQSWGVGGNVSRSTNPKSPHHPHPGTWGIWWAFRGKLRNFDQIFLMPVQCFASQIVSCGD